MTRLEREQVWALRMYVSVPDFAYGGLAMKNLEWRVKHQPAAPLAAREKHLLDLLLYHYRAQLGGRVAFDLPATKPAPPARRPTAQESLL
jgi:hypothetical protein